jgi:hypothetical protein
MTRDERWVAEFVPHGEERPRSFVVDYHPDAQFIMNAAAWLREMWGNQGDITVRHQLHEDAGWVDDSTEGYDYPSSSGDPHSPYYVENADDNSVVLGQQETSRKAAFAVYPRSGTQRSRVLLSLAHRVVGGMTREELEEHLGLGGNSVHPRVLELIEGGWVYETPDRRLTRAGHEAVVLRVTRKGLDEAAQRGDVLAAV